MILSNVLSFQEISTSPDAGAGGIHFTKKSPGASLGSLGGLSGLSGLAGASDLDKLKSEAGAGLGPGDSRLYSDAMGYTGKLGAGGGDGAMYPGEYSR